MGKERCFGIALFCIQPRFPLQIEISRNCDAARSTEWLHRNRSSPFRLLPMKKPLPTARQFVAEILRHSFLRRSEVGISSRRVQAVDFPGQAATGVNSLTDCGLENHRASRKVMPVTPPAMNMRLPNLRKARTARGGFTLVEVVLSIGVVSFVLVSMMGLLPVGMATQRQATSNMVESQIVQSLTNEILLTDFANLKNQTLSYDREGKLLSSNGASTDPQSLYDVTVTLQTLDNLQNCPVNLKTAKDEAYNVAIAVQNRTRPSETGKYSVIVARTTL